MSLGGVPYVQAIVFNLIGRVPYVQAIVFNLVGRAWGHIAVKAWGNEENPPVLTVHGLGDNLGSFDRLLPLLPASFYYICIDLPGHGKSSPYPPYLFVSTISNLFTYKLVMDYLDRKEYILMGHSWGGQAAIMFAQLYPELVLKLIVIDSYYIRSTVVEQAKRYMRNRIDKLIALNENVAKNNQVSYTYEEAVDKIITDRIAPGLEREPAIALLQRSLLEVGDGKFQFSSDPRLKLYINPLIDDAFIVEFLRIHPVMCPILFITASETVKIYNHFKAMGKEYHNHNKNIIINIVKGTHDVHTNNPEAVAPLISEFLINTKSKL